MLNFDKIYDFEQKLWGIYKCRQINYFKNERKDYMTKTVILGKVVEKKYELVTNFKTKTDDEGNETSYYIKKPYISCDYETIDYPEICSYEGVPHYNNENSAYYKKFYISEDEEVATHEIRFRADINEYHVYTDKVVKEVEVDKEKSEKALAKELKKYNKFIIENDEILKAYCDLHKLKYEDTDPDELKKLIPGKANESQTTIPFTASLNNTIWGKAYKSWADSITSTCSTPYTTSTSTNYTFKL